MAAFDYAGFRDMADEMIADAGQAGAIRRATAGSGDPWNPTGATYTDHLCTVVVGEYSQREREGGLIQVNDKRCLIAAGTLAIVPMAGDTLVLASAEYAIVECAPVSPGGLDVVYKAQVRR